MLTMEALRQLYAHQGDTAADRLGAVVFAAPDIDMDVFTSSVERVGPIARKITRPDGDKRPRARRRRAGWRAG